VASATSLTSRIRLRRTDPEKPPRHHADYQRTIDNDELPAGVDFEPVVDLWP
jgi:hypothetical protein